MTALHRAVVVMGYLSAILALVVLDVVTGRFQEWGR